MVINLLKNSKFPKIFFVKLLIPQEVVLRCVYAKQILKLSEVVGGQMVASIRQLPKSSKISKWKFPKIFSKSINKLEKFQL